MTKATSIFMIELDVIVQTHPKRIKTLPEVDDILSKVKAYEQQLACNAGVLLIQNRSLGSSYRVMSVTEAEEALKKQRSCEWGIRFYPLSFFEEVRRKLSEKENKDYEQ